jgi:hypothetical protein
MIMQDSQDPILQLKISMDTQKHFSENYQQFWHALSKMFASLTYGEILLFSFIFTISIILQITVALPTY